ncbi:MAG TPA: glycerol-3-phosphate 1-O-acyltransferase PlsY [Firmicutes bacterium]|nr:glycerol-3-phosphate 1-O-acyltransferase PlsY [Bacillota bacterium]
MTTKTLLMVIVAYLLGSIPTAYIVGRWKAGLDITQHGSGNVGGTNALRVLGVGPAILVAVSDVSKALLPTLLATRLLGGNTWPTLAVALAAIVGHNYSVYLGFRGGKGIATTLGACVVLFPKQLLIMLVLAVLVVATTRYVSLGSILLVVGLPVVLYRHQASMPELYFALVVALLGLWRHRQNIARLLKGTENRLGRKK